MRQNCSIWCFWWWQWKIKNWVRMRKRGRLITFEKMFWKDQPAHIDWLIAVLAQNSVIRVPTYARSSWQIMTVTHLSPLYRRRARGGAFVLFWDVHFWRQYILTLRGKRAPKNAIFRSKFSKKCLRTHFCPVFFSKLCLRRKKFGYNKVFLLLRENLENEFIQKKVWKSALLSWENPGSATV